MANEKRLIDANALTDKFLRHYTKQEKKGNLSFVACEIKQGFADMVNEAPTVDAVEVVRCKDCIHWYEPEGVCLKIYSDGNVSPYAWQDRKPDDFCSYGKKKI